MHAACLLTQSLFQLDKVHPSAALCSCILSSDHASAIVSLQSIPMLTLSYTMMTDALHELQLLRQSWSSSPCQVLLVPAAVSSWGSACCRLCTSYGSGSFCSCGKCSKGIRLAGGQQSGRVDCVDGCNGNPGMEPCPFCKARLMPYISLSWPIGCSLSADLPGHL